MTTMMSNRQRYSATQPRWEWVRRVLARPAFLLFSFLPVAFLLVSVLERKTARFTEEEAAVAAREAMNINAASSEDALTTILDYALPAEEDSRFAARVILARRAASGSFPNAGALGKITVPAEEIQRNEGRLTDLPARLELAQDSARQQGRRPARAIRLLSNQDLSYLKTFLWVRTPAEFRATFDRWVLVYFVSFLLASLVIPRRESQLDKYILPVCQLLTGIGLALMVSLRDPLRDSLTFVEFIRGTSAGLLIFAAVCTFGKPRKWQAFHQIPLFAAFFLATLLLLFGTGPGNGDARVNLWGFQPAEFIKILVLLFLSGFLAERWEYLRTYPESTFASWIHLPRFRDALPLLLGVLAVVAFFFDCKDLGPALVLAVLFLALFGIARGKWILSLAGLLSIASAFSLAFFLGWPETATQRIRIWLDPWSNRVAGGDHLAQSLWAFASGAWKGSGIGRGDPSLIPEVHTDLILAASGEELGLWGVALIFVLYSVLAYCGIRVAARSQDGYGVFMASGATLLLLLPLLLISCGVLGVFPLSGVVSPFLSYGKTAMIANFFLAGLLVALDQEASGTPSSQLTELKRSLKVPLFLFGAVFLILTTQVFRVQVLEADELLVRGCLVPQRDEVARYQYNPRLLKLLNAGLMARGTITDRNGTVLATSDWSELEKSKPALGALGINVEETCSKRDRRHYPLGASAFYLLGDPRKAIKRGARNTAFVERELNTYLQGFDDKPQTERDPGSGALIIRRDYSELIPLFRHRFDLSHPDAAALLNRPRNVRLHLDSRLQMRVEGILSAQLEKERLPRGAAVVVDVETGGILAAVSLPSPRELYGPKIPYKAVLEKAGGWQDRARFGIYPPGSTFKIVTALAALRKDPAAWSQLFPCEHLGPGECGTRGRGWKRPVRDYRCPPHGNIGLAEAITVSCNAYFAQLGTFFVGATQLHETAKLFNITRIGRPDSPAGLRGVLPMASFGQGPVSTTPLQMARVAAAVANQGIFKPGGLVASPSEKRPAATIVAPDSAALLGAAMRSVVTRGTARGLLSTGVDIAGKTGTADVEGKAPHSWFIGYAPSSPSPKIAFAVIVENGGLGGRIAAPAALQIAVAAKELSLWD